MRLFVAILLSFAGFAAQGAAHTHARLLLAADTVRPGETVLAGLQLRMDPGWHTYWRNSGQAGLPTTIDWQLPAGVTPGTIQWPPPQKIPEQEVTTYVYDGEVVLLVPLKVASIVAAGPLNFKAKVAWLECETSCIPGSASVEAKLTVGAETKSSKDLPLLQAAEKALPKNDQGTSVKASWDGAPKGGSRPLLIEWRSAAAAGETSEADFYPDSSESFEVLPLLKRLSGPPGKVRLRAEVKLPEGARAGQWPAEISGLLIEQTKSQRLAYETRLQLGQATTAVGPVAGATDAPPLWKMFLYAFLGGLILNIMPCVLPVIALKILGFVSEAKNELSHVRKLGLIYTAGVLASFLALALVVVGLQAAGKGAGWGFQFANPYFLVAMTTLVTLISLNLFGVFEINLDSSTMTAAAGLASKGGAAGAFFNGLLATVLATSCSAPFLGFAIGVAFTLGKPAITILILLTVGLGLAAPYLVLSWQPAWLRVLPKPGRWMQRFKVAMGFPMMAAAAWLCSLEAAHYGDRTWWMVMFLVLVALAAWVYGEFVQRGSERRGLAVLVSLILLGVGYGFVLENKMDWREPIGENTAQGEPSKVVPKGVAWQPWSSAAVAEARAAGKVVVVDFTARWCPTCNTIVKPSFESSSVQQKLKELNAVALVADYTHRGDDILNELKRFQRAGVPLVLIYPRKANEPPQVYDWVSPGRIVEGLDQATQ